MSGDRKSGPHPHGLDPDWMPERAALMRKYGPDRHLHFPPHLLPLAEAIDRLCFNRPLPPWEKEWEEMGEARAQIVRALRHRAGTPNRQQEAPEA
ncbi:MAG: hypothetical protein OXC14_00255 [Rhodospirillaceae bacterium]|nr:hypothetical protein [Rhodospirillaceae bacterium]